MLKLWCAGRLKDCPKNVNRFRFSCLSCRLRRKYYGKYSEPSYHIKYTYKNIVRHFLVDYYVNGGYAYRSLSGRKLYVRRHYHVLIDPRGHFTRFRCAAIQVLDNLLGLTRWKQFFGNNKPLVEFAEFLANYPTW